jgi:ligand-binding SRPBCC domain-containing protein
MYYMKYLQKLPVSVEEAWSFFSSPNNLKVLTPTHLGFEIMNDLEDRKMYAGQIIAYTITPLWRLPLQWVTEITHVQEPHYFIDEQRLGPYKFWHHEHRFNPIPNGVEISDTVYYQLPFGLLGTVLHCLKIKRDLETIFSYRKTKLETLFGQYSEDMD